MKKNVTIILIIFLLSAVLTAQTESPVDSLDALIVDDDMRMEKSKIDSVIVENVHPQDSPQGRGFLIRARSGDAQLRIRGSIRVNGIYDFNGLQDANTFPTYDIPTGDLNKTEPRYRLGADQTRFGIEASRSTSQGDIFMRIEGDFLGQDETFRLRHGYGTFRNFVIGQTWSTFSDLMALPTTVDLDGPSGSLAERTVLVRYTKNVTDDFRWALSFESPTAEFTTPDSAVVNQAYQSYTDWVGRIRKYGDWGQLQLAGIFRSITHKDTSNSIQYLYGYGGLLSGVMNLVEKNNIRFQVYWGQAISRYVTGLTGRGLDVVYNPLTQQFEPVLTLGGYLSYGHYWQPNLYSFLPLASSILSTKIINGPTPLITANIHRSICFGMLFPARALVSSIPLAAVWTRMALPVLPIDFHLLPIMIFKKVGEMNQDIIMFFRKMRT